MNKPSFQSLLPTQTAIFLIIHSSLLVRYDNCFTSLAIYVYIYIHNSDAGVLTVGFRPRRLVSNFLHFSVFFFFVETFCCALSPRKAKQCPEKAAHH